jgi:hypothetical protein
MCILQIKIIGINWCLKFIHDHLQQRSNMDTDVG